MKLLSLSIQGNPAYHVTGYSVQTPQDITNITKLDLNTLIHRIITLTLDAIILLSFIFVLIGGLKWMLSQGDKKGIDEARKTITLAIGGLLLAFLSFFIINLIGYAFNVPLLGK